MIAKGIQNTLSNAIFINFQHLSKNISRWGLNPSFLHLLWLFTTSYLGFIFALCLSNPHRRFAKVCRFITSLPSLLRSSFVKQLTEGHLKVELHFSLAYAPHLRLSKSWPKSHHFNTLFESSILISSLNCFIIQDST